MKTIFANKKGTIMDILLVAIIAFVVIVLFVSVGIAYKKTGAALDSLKGTIDVASYDESVDVITVQANKYANFWDYLIVLILFGGWIALIMASYLLGNEPLFITIFVVVLIALLIISAVFQVVARNMLESDGFGEFIADYPITSFYMKYMFLFNLFFVLCSGIALYLKQGVAG